MLNQDSETSLNHYVLSGSSKFWLVCEQFNRKTGNVSKSILNFEEIFLLTFFLDIPLCLTLMHCYLTSQWEACAFGVNSFLIDLLLMYINQFQGQQDKVTFEMLSQEMDLYSSKIILIHMRLFTMKKY